jgi:hypothetical protein
MKIATFMPRALFAVLFCFASYLPAAEFYVATNGLDTNPGTEALPFRTLTRTRDAVRAINSAMAEDIHVYIRGGEYPVTGTVQFSAQDSGKNGYKVHYCAYPGENPVLTGGKTVANWTLHDSTKNIYRASVGANLFRQLYINQTSQAIRARTPNRNTAATDRSGYWPSIVPELGKVRTARANWDASAALVPAAKLAEVEMVMEHHWYHQRIRIGSHTDLGSMIEITPVNPTGKFTKELYFYQPTTSDMKNPTYFENALAFVDADYEWYHDPGTGYLYLALPAGTAPDSHRIDIPSTQTLLSITGTGTSPVHDIEFHGLTFQCSNWTAPSTQGANMTQAAQSVGGHAQPTAMIKATHALRIGFRHGIIRNAGGQGIELYNVDASGIELNEFYNIAANGILIDHGTGNNPPPEKQSENTAIWNNHARKCGNDYANGDFIMANNVEGLIVDHNLIHDMPYSGMQIGQQPGSGALVDVGCTRNQVRYNYIHHCTQVHPDGGGIYTLGGIQTHSVIAENYTHDIRRSPYHLNDYQVDHIYLDNNTSGIEVRNNVVAGGAAVQRNGSSGNYFLNNVQGNAAIENNAGIRPGYRPERSGHIHRGTVLAQPLPWIEVYGNGQRIISRNNLCPCGYHSPTPGVADGTHFGFVKTDEWVERTFTIKNSGISGGVNLLLTNSPGSVVELAGDPEFQLVADASPATIASGGSVTFTIRFTPSAEAVYNGTVRIANNDQYSGPYEFAITGTAIPPVAPVVNAGPDQTVALSGSNPIPWTPEELTKAAWYDAADASTITASSGAVSQWRDKSASARNLNQSTPGARPQTGTRTIGGLNAIEFDGADDVLIGSANKTDAITIFGVVLTDSGSGTDSNRSWLSSPGGSNPDYWMKSPADNDSLGGMMCDTGGAYSSGDATAARSAAHIHAAYSWVAGGANGGTRIDGGASVASIAATSKSLQQSATELAIGRQKNTAGRFHDGLVGEVVIINQRLTDADADFLKIEGYLAHKWGLAANLPETHLYKNAAPTQEAVPSATATLAGSATDADNDPLTTTWSVISSPAGGGATFANDSALNTTATFTAAGVYVLRLTADDGMVSAYDDVTITVTDGTTGLDAFNDWTIGGGGGGGVTFTGDSNSDGIADGMAWLLGADGPTQDANGLLPQSAVTNGDLTLTFKMLNPGKRGTAVLRLEHSHDLGVTDPWTENTIIIPDTNSTVDGVKFTITPIDGTDHNQVTATLPAAAANGTGKVFVRLSGVLSP